MNRFIIVLVTFGSLLSFCQPGLAFLPGGQLKVSMSIVISPVEGSSEVLCDNSDFIARNIEWRWWLSMNTAGDGMGVLTSTPVKCGTGVFEGNHDEPSEQEETPYLLSAGYLRALIVPQMQNERVVKLLVTTQKEQTVSEAQDQAKDNFVPDIQRELIFTDDREIIIPLFLANSEQRDSLGIRAVYLRVALAEQQEAANSVFGTIWVNSESIDADVLLDGGVVAKISTSGDLILKNVKVGEHEISLQTPEGIQTRKYVNVIADRTILATLDPLTSQQPAPPYQLETLEKNSQGYDEFRRTIDGAVVIKISEGEFLMGNTETERSPFEHKVYLSSFLMDKTGVTWGQYKLFAEQTGTPLPPHDPYWGILDDHPAAFVTWEEAGNYCHWAGGRLPTEAEREKAARGTDGRMFPWGNEEPRPELAVFRKSWGYHSTGVVGQRPDGASPYGLLDVGGNVWEWCSDWYSNDYYEMSPYRDPEGPAYGIAHVVRGGSWDSRPTVLSSSCRSWGHRGYRDGDFGFRCAMNSTE